MTVVVQHDKTKKIAIAINKISLVCCIHFCQLKDLDDFVADAFVVERCGALRVLGRIFFCKWVCVCLVKFIFLNKLSSQHLRVLRR